MIIDEKGQIMGMGLINKEGNYVKESPQFKMIEIPKDCSKVYLKEAVGKFFRLLLTAEHKLLFNGKNKYYAAGSPERNAYYDNFNDITDKFELEPDEKIIDVDGGRYSIVIVTNKGNVYATGTQLY